MKLAKKDKLHILIGAALFLLAYLWLPVEHGLTRDGKNFLAVFLMVVYLWTTVDTAVPSLIGLGMMGLLQVFSASDLIALSMGAYTVGIITATAMLVDEVSEAGILKKVAQWFISRPVVAGRPYVFFFCFALADFLVGMLIGFLFSVLVFVPMALGICESIGVKKGDGIHRALMVLIIWNSSFGQIAAPFNKPVNLTAISALQSMGYSVTYAAYMRVLLPCTLGLFVAGLLVIRFVVRPDVAKLRTYDPGVVRAEMKAAPFNRRQLYLTGGFLLLIATWLLTLFDGFFALATYFNTVGTAVTALLVVGVLCFLPADGEPVIDLSRALANMPWKVIVFLWMIYLTSTGMSMEELGIQTMLVQLLGPAIHGIPPALVVLLGLVLCSVMTNLMSDAVSIIVTLSVFLPILSSLPGSTIHPVVFGLAANMISQIGYLVPSSSPICPLILGPQITVKQGFCPTFIITLVGILLGFLYVMLFS